MQYHRLGRLDDRVRNGNGYDPTNIATNKDPVGWLKPTGLNFMNDEVATMSSNNFSYKM